MEYLKVYKRDDELVTNGEKGRLPATMSALRSFYNYYFKRSGYLQEPDFAGGYAKTS